MFVNNARWDGVPFLLKAGKALHSRVAEIRVQFRHVPGNLYRNKLGLDLDKATNELVGGRGDGQGPPRVLGLGGRRRGKESWWRGGAAQLLSRVFRLAGCTAAAAFLAAPPGQR